jgi:hypothetical protein
MRHVGTIGMIGVGTSVAMSVTTDRAATSVTIARVGTSALATTAVTGTLAPSMSLRLLCPRPWHCQRAARPTAQGAQ